MTMFNATSIDVATSSMISHVEIWEKTDDIDKIGVHHRLVCLFIPRDQVDLALKRTKEHARLLLKASFLITLSWQWWRQTPSYRLIGSSTALSLTHYTPQRERENVKKTREMRKVIRSRCRFEQSSTRCDNEEGGRKLLLASLALFMEDSQTHPEKWIVM